MSISKQIIFSSTLVGLLALFAGYMGWKNMNMLQADGQSYLQNSVDITAGLIGIQSNLDEIHKWFLADAKTGNIEQLFRSFDQNINAIKTFNPTITEKLSAVKNGYFELYQKHQNQSGQVYTKALESFTLSGEDILREAHQMNSHAIQNHSTTINSHIASLEFWILTICLLIFAMAIVFGQLIAKALSKSLLSLENAAVQIRNGNYSSRVSVNAKNEFGYLAKSFNLLAEGAEQSEIIKDQIDQLEVLNKALKLKNDSLDSFVYRVSHDLKAPLINLISLQEVIKSKVKHLEDKAVHRSLKFMEMNSNRLQQTIQDLLEVSRIERELNDDKNWVNIESNIQNILDENNEIIRSTGMVINCNLEVENVYFSNANLKSVLSNIITNSIKYRKAEGINTLKINSYTEGDFTFLEFEDNGIGIDLETHSDKLFGIFNRFHNHVEGSGVGLYIVKKIIDENGGAILVDSEVGKGTTFKISFPNPKDKMSQSNIQVTMSN